MLRLKYKHRLMCGDSTSKEDVDRLIANNEIDMVNTDPPYGINYGGDNPGKDRNNSKIMNDDRYDFIEAINLINADICYLFHASLFSSYWQSSLESSDYQVRNQIIWNKSIHALSRGDYHFKHEPCWYAVKNGKTSKRTDDRTQTTVWDFPPPHGYASKEEHTGHPTQKPVDLFVKAINNHHIENVADPFLGSGTTLIACEKTNRRCFGMEIDPHYCSVIIKRWEEYTGLKAVREREIV